MFSLFFISVPLSSKYGARPLRRAVQRYVEDELSEMILRGNLSNGQTIHIDEQDNKLTFNIKR